MRGARPILALGLALALAGCGAGALVRPMTPRVVADGTLVVTPASAWNRVASSALFSRRPYEVWTKDGLSLNDLSYLGGLKDNQTLFRDVERRDRPLPRFRSTMLPQEVAEFFESSYRIAGGSPLFTITSVAPATFAGRPGFRFTYDFTLYDDVKRKGVATGAIIDGRLFLISYEAPALFYFARDLAEYERLIASARIA